MSVKIRLASGTLGGCYFLRKFKSRSHNRG